MTTKEIRNAIASYRKMFEEKGVGKEPFTEDGFPKLRKMHLAHCHWMLDRIEEFLAEGRREKAYGWLCFIQGCLWLCQMHTLQEMRSHNHSVVPQ